VLARVPEVSAVVHAVAPTIWAWTPWA
jgi:hypothetical protein